MAGADAMYGMTMRFKVTIDGHDLDHWAKASGLEVTWDLVEYRSGNNGNERWIYPGNTKYPTVKLARAAEAKTSETVRTWLNDTSFTHDAAGTASIELLDAKKDPVAKWQLRGVMPLKWSITAFDGGGNAVAIETLELAHLGFLDETNGGPA
jgi:phage tail-like protein